MKTLTDIKSEISGDTITITAKIIEKSFNFPVQQVTIGHLADNNIKWARHVQLSQEAVFVKRIGVGVAFEIDDMIDIAAQIEPKLTWPPLFKKQPNTQSLSVDICSELNPSLQWKVSDDAKSWSDIQNATASALDRGNLASGKFVKCVASCEAGEAESSIVKLN